MGPVDLPPRQAALRHFDDADVAGELGGLAQSTRLARAE
jgi:hypothetical protein